MNSLIYNFLNEYYNNPDPQYAIFLKGSWGCGKTHFIKKWLWQYKAKEHSDEATTISLEPIYVSLYGLRTIEEIKTAIDREINPFFYSKTGKILKGVASIIGRVVLKTSIDFDKDGKDDASITGSIDSLSVFHSKEDVVKGNKFIVFDDIERCQVEIKTLLGFINFFVEHCNCHVVVIGDDSKLSTCRKKQLDEFREKTIGREFTIEPDTEDAIDYFLSEPYFDDYLKLERDYIIKGFICTGSNNLRILRQCLMDFSTQIREIDPDAIKNGNLFLHGLLGSFIAVYSELNSKDNHDAFVDFAKFYRLGATGMDNENGKKLRSLNQKYNEISQGCIYHTLSTIIVHNIVSHITIGTSLREYIANHLNDSAKSYSSWEKLDGFWKLNNEEFYALYHDAMDALLADKIELPYQIGTTIGYFGYFDATEVRKITKTNLDQIKSGLRKRIRAIDDLENLYEVRISLLQGINNARIIGKGTKMPILDECATVVQKAFDQKSKTLPDEMQKVLRSLSDDNLNELFEIDNRTYPDKYTSYQMKAIFQHENVDDLFAKICCLSNNGKNDFCTFLSKHYMFSSSLHDLPDYFSMDKKVLVGLEKRVKAILPKTKGVDKLAYRKLEESLLSAIQRSKGVKEPLE